MASLPHHLLNQDATLKSPSSCMEEPSSSYVKEHTLSSTANVCGRKSAANVGFVEKSGVNEEHKPGHAFCRNRRYRRRADLPPDVLAKVREKDKERKRITRLKLRGVGEYPHMKQKWPSGLDLLTITERNAIVRSNGILDPLNGWNTEESSRREPSLTVQEYLIGQTVNDEEKVESDVGRKSNISPSFTLSTSSVCSSPTAKQESASDCNWLKCEDIRKGVGDDISRDGTVAKMARDVIPHTQSLNSFSMHYKNMFSPTSIEHESFCLPDVAIAGREGNTSDTCTMLGGSVPLVLTKIPGYEIINVAVNCDSEKEHHIETNTSGHSLCSDEVCEESEGRGHTHEISGLRDGDAVESEQFHLTTCISNSEVAKQVRRRQRSRSVLSPEKLAYIRAVDAERKRIARTRVRLLEMGEAERSGTMKRHRLVKRLKHSINMEDAARFGWPDLDDEHKERSVLEKRLEKYRMVIAKMVELEKETADGLLPLEVLRAMVIEQARLFTFLTQRNDLRRNQVKLIGSDESVGTVSTVEGSMPRLDESRKTQMSSNVVVGLSSKKSEDPILRERDSLVDCRRRSSSELQTKLRTSEVAKMEVKSDVAVAQISNKIPLMARGLKRKPVIRSSLNDEELTMRRAIEAARKRIWRAKRRAELVKSNGIAR
uniref:Uncharacterized protein n=1 Tax=Parascaris univalens TaxID=6257 RepID=A0A915AQ59_PARUN